MNIVYLIGNGFDLSKGLPTSYPQFYNYYCSLPSPNNDLAELKEEITRGDNWSDLEFALGEYSAKFDSKERLAKLHKDLRTKLRDYLIKVEAHYHCDDSQKDLLMSDLLSPEKYLRDTEQRVITDIKNQSWTSEKINIITFNYTDTLERLINCKEEDPVNSITHVHGTLKNNGRDMILGVDNDNQMSNKTLCVDRLIRRKFIKSESNAINGTDRDKYCKDLIYKADLICLFGVSFGDTDALWWGHIARRLINNSSSKLIIFIHKRDFETNIDDDIADILEKDEEIKDMFLSKRSLMRRSMNLLNPKFLSASTPICSATSTSHTTIVGIAGRKNNI
ncbi:MAG: bacteriophage abortive infection AbiH family protein [Rikenellaceae bacterium]